MITRTLAVAGSIAALSRHRHADRGGSCDQARIARPLMTPPGRGG